MEIRWSQEATADLTGIIHYIKQDNPEAALRVARTIYETCEIEELSQSWPAWARCGNT
jgi:plasmid stabilization system protein ParE